MSASTRFTYLLAPPRPLGSPRCFPGCLPGVGINWTAPRRLLPLLLLLLGTLQQPVEALMMSRSPLTTLQCCLCCCCCCQPTLLPMQLPRERWPPGTAPSAARAPLHCRVVLQASAPSSPQSTCGVLPQRVGQWRDAVDKFKTGYATEVFRAATAAGGEKGQDSRVRGTKLHKTAPHTG